MPKQIKYIFISVILWFIVDFGTAGGFNPGYLKTYMPALLFFYIGFPMLFAFLICRKNWQGRKLFIAFIAQIFIVEALFVKNPFIISFPLLLIGIPLAVFIYIPVTYFPKWIVNGETGQNKKIIILSSVMTILVILISIMDKWK